MKNCILLLTAFLISASVFAQAPQKMNYQGVARDNSGNVLANQNIALRLSILSGSISGTVEFGETHAVTTNDFGLFSVHIGDGTFVPGNGNLVWGSDLHFLKVEMDATGGSNYTELGTSQFVSVPYAFYAEKAGSFEDGTAMGEMRYWDGSAWVSLAPGANGQQLTFCYGVPTWGHCLQVGDVYQGGKIAKILQPGETGYDNLVPHGLIVSLVDQGTTVTWYNGTAAVTGATDYNDGNANTYQTIVVQGAGSYAAQICADLSLNGYDDWYLPSAGEAYIISLNSSALSAQLYTGFYWTSTEVSASDAYYINFASGNPPQIVGKSNSIRVRAVRSF